MSNNSPIDPLDKSISALKTKEPHIHSLRFPNYRNLQLNCKLPFEFPITVLLGRNGTNKSSILHALYGSTLGRSLGTFWFETALDAIPDTRNDLKQSVVHSYKIDNELVECIKVRAPRGEKDPDYWEPVRPTQKYGFPPDTIRQRPISLKVTHLDFRGELPAFDKYFYFPDPKHLASRVLSAKKRGKLRREYRQQDYIRQRSGRVKNQIEKSGILLTDEEIKVLRYILERDYLSGKVLRHSLYHGHEGWTILFKTKHVDTYSDAFAGSGESAATLLVHNILKASNGSLILLDEPETSLHPRAQQRMLEFLAHQAVRKSLQIVMTTHSQYLAERLPQKAIKVLVLESDGVQVRTNLSVNEALHEISTLSFGRTILVEDKRAQHVVIEALKLESSQALKDFQVVVRDGGTATIYRDIQAYATSGSKDVFVIFDGDHEPEESIPSGDQLPQGKAGLDKLIQSITRGNNKNGPKFNFFDVAERTCYIGFLRKYVKYLPEMTPEQLVWNEEAAKEILGTEIPEEILQEKDFKIRLQLLAQQKPGFDADTAFKVLLSKLFESNDQRKLALMKCIQEIRDISSMA